MLRKTSRFRNPEFRDRVAKARQYERNPNFRKRFKRAAIILAAFFVLYYLGVSSRFLVAKVESGDSNLTAEQITDVLKRMQKQRIGYLVPKNHFLVLSKTSLLAALQQELPQVRSIQNFKKRFPDTLAVGIEERTPLYVWQTHANYFLLDQDGVIFQRIESFSPETFSQILITDQSGSAVKPGDQLGIQPILDFIVQIKNNWAASISQTAFVSFSAPGTKSQDLILNTSTGYSVLFDLTRSPQTQLSNLRLLLSQEIKPETYTGLSYIDLRLPTTAYYCYRDAPCAQDNATSTPKI